MQRKPIPGQAAVTAAGNCASQFDKRPGQKRNGKNGIKRAQGKAVRERGMEVQPETDSNLQLRANAFNSVTSFSSVLFLLFGW